MSAINKEIGLRIRAMRKKYGLSQIELAEKINLSFQQIQKYEKGMTAISVARLQQIADAFGVTVHSFYNEAPGSVIVGESRPSYGPGTGPPAPPAFFSREERILLKTFRKIQSEKIRKGVIQQLKGLAELERQSRS